MNTLLATTSWRLLINAVSGNGSTARVRLWRRLKTVGAVALRDGAYLLPARTETEAVLRNIRDELLTAGGLAYVIAVAQQDFELQVEWGQLFDRANDYTQWSASLTELLESLPEREGEARRMLRQRRKDLDAIASIDFFAGESLEQSRRQFQDAERRLTRHYSPDEPLAVAGDVVARRLSDYQGKVWATRARPWVDRIASAWLIQRFIDPAAHFLWLKDIGACPADALGFDFDGATFTHVGDRVSFEVLLASFDLGSDPALGRVAALVHASDIGGEPTAEGAGFEAILTGARARLSDDDSLLGEVGKTLDSLYSYFQSDRAKTK